MLCTSTSLEARTIRSSVHVHGLPLGPCLPVAHSGSLARLGPCCLSYLAVPASGEVMCVCVCVPLQLKAGTACWVCQAPRKPRADSAHEAGCSQRMQSTRHLMKQAALSACKAHVIWAGSTCSLI